MILVSSDDNSDPMVTSISMSMFCLVVGSEASRVWWSAYDFPEVAWWCRGNQCAKRQSNTTSRFNPHAGQGYCQPRSLHVQCLRSHSILVASFHRPPANSAGLARVLCCFGQLVMSKAHRVPSLRHLNRV